MWRSNPSAGYAIVERDGIAVHLFQEDVKQSVPVGVHIFTPCIQNYGRRGATISQEIARKPWGNRDFRVTDSAGNVLKFTEPLTDE